MCVTINQATKDTLLIKNQRKDDSLIIRYLKIFFYEKNYLWDLLSKYVPVCKNWLASDALIFGSFHLKSWI